MIEINGLEGLEKRLEDLVSADNAEQALQKACALVEREAKQKAPKGTGELRRSITSRIERDGDDFRGIVFTPLEYAPYVEYGTGLFAEEQGRSDVPWSYQDDEGNWHTTSGMHPRPYMRPALDENREQILEILRGALFND